MKNIITLIVAIAGFFVVNLLPKETKATHAAGAELIYIHISDSTYQFFFKFYRDCGGVAQPGTVTMCLYNSCTNQTYTKPLNIWTGSLPPDSRPNGAPVSPGCSDSKTNCEPGGTLPGYREWWYERIETLPLSCNFWRFSVSINARNPSENLAPTGTNDLYVETIFDNTVTHENSSPYYSVKPVPYVCINQPYVYNNGAKDRDPGDSLFTNVINPLTTQTSNCAGPVLQNQFKNINPPVTFPTNPFQTGNTFFLNGFTGQMSFVPPQLGKHALTIKTREFKKDKNNVMKEIGSIMRDIQVQVILCSLQPPKIDTPKIVPGPPTAGIFNGCIDQKIEFCFDVKSSKTNTKFRVEDNLALSIPGAKMTYKNQYTNDVNVCFEWTPTLADAGKTHNFQVTIVDSTCEPPGILLYYVRDVSIYVWPPVEATPDTSICVGEPAFLGVKGGGNYQWSVVSGTNPSLNNPNSATPIATPKVTTTYAVVSNANTYCLNNKDTVTISVLKGPDIAGQSDVITCPNNAVQLNVGIDRKPGVTYNIEWTPSTGLNNNKKEDPISTLKNDIVYVAAIGSDVNRCKTYDTVVMDILDGVMIENPDTPICEGQSVDVRGKGDNRYNFTWTSTDPAASISNPADIITNIKPSDTGTYQFTLTARYPGCVKDSVVDFLIEVQPNPDVTVDDDAILCYGDTMQLHGVVMPDSYDKYSYTWTPGALLDFPNRKAPIFTGAQEGQHTLTLVASTSAGCSDSDKVELNVFPAEFLFVPPDTAICPGDTIVLDVTANGNPEYYWLPDFNISSISSLQPRVWPVTDQVYTIIGVDTLGCMDTNEVKISVYPRAVIEIPEEITLYPGESYQLDPGGNCIYYTWFPPLGLNHADLSNPTLSPKVNTRYIVHARTEAGCGVVDSMDVFIKDDDVIDVPNAFTPGHRSNNVLKILGRTDIKLKSFAVYNRWGEKVFETQDIAEGWDGTYNGEMQPTGVYVYTVDAVTGSGRHVKKQGNVTLLK